MGHGHKKKKSKHRHRRKDSKQKMLKESNSVKEVLPKQRSISQSLGKQPVEPPVKGPEMAKNAVDDETPTCLLAPADYCNIFSIGKKINNQGALKTVDKQKIKEKVEPDQLPTIMIAPADYQNFYSKQKVTGNEKVGSVQRIPSDTPTALVAPDDYMCLYSRQKNESKQPANVNIALTKTASKQNQPAQKVQPEKPSVGQVASDTPTALIAPADYVCIYKNPKNRLKDNENSPNDED